METIRTEAYEVRCNRCDTSFAPGTRRCVHCGERIGRRPTPDALVRVGAAEPEEDSDMSVSPGRVGLWVVTAAVMLAGSVFRICGGGG